MSTDLKPLPPALQAGVQACLFAGLLLPSRPLRALFFPPILAMSLYMIFFTTTGKDSDDIVTWSLITTTLLQASDTLVINDVAALRLVGQKVPTNELGLWSRIKWAAQLLGAPRAVGWTHEPRHVFPPHPDAKEPRLRFLVRQTLTALQYFVILDVVHYWILHTPQFVRDGVSLTTGGPAIRVLNTALHAIHIWSYMSFGYTAASVVAVALGVTDQSAWPAIYGKWSDAYTLRRFWGRTWHQVFRRTVSTHGDFVTYRVLRLQKSTFLADSVHRYTAFFVSGVIHGVGEYGLFRDNARTDSGALRFFLLQATAITAEQIIARLFNPRPTTWMCRLGYVWTFVWFVYTLPPWMDPQFRKGMADNYGFPFSVTNGLVNGEWRLVA
ncbi:hypothetical protein DENSPDRAFT_818409 [Dentipellis sp. KUC8613]|nr:hypothetical protein DENSPDRAFT_818409 [Dentipellis sp. KUC8613]